MDVYHTTILTVVAIVAMIRAFTLLFRYLEHGIAYLRNGQVVVDWAMPIQGIAIAVLALVGSIATIRIDPSYPLGSGVLSLVVLGAAGGGGLIVFCLFLMQRCDMNMTIENNQPLFMPDRTPGHRSTENVTVYVGGPSSYATRQRGVVHLR